MEFKKQFLVETNGSLDQNSIFTKEILRLPKFVMSLN